jgi:CheY-like chemotaxis protein
MSGQKTILFVDDDTAFLQLTGELMQQASSGGWQVIMADNPARALGALKEHNFDMIVVDERMPVMSGLQFVRLARARFPNVPIVVLTGHADQHTKDDLAREGVAVMLEKPTSSEGFHTLFLTLNELLALERSKGFRGLMQDVELQDILQLECLRRNSSVLEVFSKSEAGEIVIRSGNVVHATVGTLSGEPAFFHLLNLHDGEFRLKPYAEPAEKTISRHWENLLMEAAQLRDEVADQEASAKPAEAAAAPLTPKFPPIELTDQERASLQPPRRLLAVSIEGRVLAGETGDATSLPRQLADLLENTAWFKTAAGLGTLELFEASTPREETVIQFQPESVVLVQQAREVPA